MRVVTVRRPFREGLLLAALTLASSFCFFAAIVFTQSRSHFSFAGFWALRLCLLGACFLLVSAAFYFALVRERIKNRIIQSFGIAGYSLLSCFLLLEAIFMFVPKSHAVGEALAMQAWHRYYWYPVNQLGYRDAPIEPAQPADKKLIFALGDSFTAGWGITHAEDRFPDQLATRLPAGFRVVNLGKPGSDSRDEFNRLMEFPLRPQILILQYCGNDIEPVIHEAGIPLDYRSYQTTPRLLKPLITGSYLINYVYWQLPRSQDKKVSAAFMAAYRDHELLARHLHDLYRFVEYSHRHHVPLAVVIFPFLQSLESSRDFIVPVQRFFEKSGSPVIDVSTLVQDIPPAKRVVNTSDGHASVEVNRRVGAELQRVLMDSGWIQPQT